MLILKATKQTVNKVPSLSFKKDEYLEYLSKFVDGKEFVITVEEKRTLDQNSCLWGWSNVIAEKTNQPLQQTFDDIVMINFGYYSTFDDDQNQIIRPISTSSLSKSKFTDALNRTFVWAKETFDIELPNIDNYYKVT